MENYYRVTQIGTGRYRIYDPEGHFIGLYTADFNKRKLMPYKLFFDMQD